MPKSNRDLIMARVDLESDAPCWRWTGHLTNGYGRIKLNGVRRNAHVASYLEFVGPYADGLHLDHLCRNPFCVNPEHLEPVTPGENVRRGISPAAQNAAKTHCMRGHELSPENAVERATGGRRCRQCMRDYAAQQPRSTREAEKWAARYARLIERNPHLAR